MAPPKAELRDAALRRRDEVDGAIPDVALIPAGTDDETIDIIVIDLETLDLRG